MFNIFLSSLARLLLTHLVMLAPIYAENSIDACLDFGRDIIVFTDLEKLSKEAAEVKSTLELNGDGVKDRVVLLSISKRSKFAPDVIVSNPFKRQVFHVGDANLTDKPHMAIGIIHSATKTKPCKKFIIYNNAVFSEWNGSVETLRTTRGMLIVEVNPSYNAKNDKIVVWTPNADVNLLFWGGKAYSAEFVSSPEGEY
jgi:hypothetical protein